MMNAVSFVSRLLAGASPVTRRSTRRAQRACTHLNAGQTRMDAGKRRQNAVFFPARRRAGRGIRVSSTVAQLRRAYREFYSGQLAALQTAESQLAESQLAESQLAESQLAESQEAESQLAESQLAESHEAESQLALLKMVESQLAASKTGLPVVM